MQGICCFFHFFLDYIFIRPSYKGTTIKHSPADNNLFLSIIGDFLWYVELWQDYNWIMLVTFHSSFTKRNRRERGPSNYFILCIETIHIFIWEALSCDFLLCIIRSIESFPWLFLCKAFLFSCFDPSQSSLSDWRFVLAGISPVLMLYFKASVLVFMI